VAGAFGLDEHGSSAEDPEPQLAREGPSLAVVKDDPGVLELEAQTYGFALARAEMGSDHAGIGRPTERTHIDPACENGPTVRSFGGDSGRDDNSTEEGGQDLELIDPAERDERAGVDYDG